MKSNTTINMIANRATLIIAAILMGLNLTSCAGNDAEAAISAGGDDQVTSATITYKYTVPAELLKYAEITMAYNNNAGDDSLWEPMLDNVFTMTYHIDKFPVTAPLVALYDFTNRPAKGVDVDWEITTDVEVTIHIGARVITKTHSYTYNINGDAQQGLEKLMKSARDRTYVTKISKTGSIEFVD